ncbi:hypothetical protein GCM10009677_02080 [Sphaerisporangium rubeum]|uniref:VWA domain-containing protein n=1 Tax=Sphaerisporangium rubeum TaxID=321317 RepID=A0A7X0IDB2_9ACTN|nr:hypothetical protein [Sphaerisporangium rubeum]MBB6473159.1 hypothetical protein [Sphaerisporangium rubeum]
MTNLRRGLAAAAIAAAALPLSSCGEDPEPLATPCAVVLDGSGSGEALKVEQLMRQHLLAFISEKKCGVVSFVPITGNSASSRCYVPDVDLDPPKKANTDRDRIRAAALQNVKTNATAMLKCAKQEEDTVAPGSDIVGGLRRAVEKRPDGTGYYEILVISDFGQSAGGIDLYHDRQLGSKQHRTVLIAKLAAKARIPDLSQAHITTRGFGAGLPEVGLLKAFWVELITGPGKGTVPDKLP